MVKSVIMMNQDERDIKDPDIPASDNRKIVRDAFWRAIFKEDTINEKVD
jgi:hypothetical protein